MGSCIRSSNRLDGRNFHLRIPVQMRNARPIEPASDTRTTIVFRATATPWVAAAEGLPVPVGSADVEEPDTPTMTVLVFPAWMAIGVVLVGCGGGVEVVNGVVEVAEVVVFRANDDVDVEVALRLNEEVEIVDEVVDVEAELDVG